MPRRANLAFEELVVLLGWKKALKLCRHHYGKTIPSPLQALRNRRDAALIKDFQAGAQVGELSAKYNLHRSVVQRKITEYAKKHPEEFHL